MVKKNLISVNLAYIDSKIVLMYEDARVGINSIEAKYGPNTKELIEDIFNKIIDPTAESLLMYNINMDFSHVNVEAAICKFDCFKRFEKTIRLKKEIAEDIDRVLAHDPVISNIYCNLRKSSKMVFNPTLKSIDVLYRSGGTKVIAKYVDWNGIPYTQEDILSTNNVFSAILGSMAMTDMDSKNSITSAHISFNDGILETIQFGYTRVDGFVEIVDPNRIMISKKSLERDLFKSSPICEYFWVDEENPAPGYGIVVPIANEILNDPIGGWLIKA